MINIGSGMIPRLKTREIAGLLMIALLLTASAGTLVNRFTDQWLPSVNVTIRRADQETGRNTTVLFESYENNPDELFRELKEANASDGNSWQYVEGVPGESWTMLVDSPQSREITIRVKESPRKYLTLLCNRGGGIIEITAGENTWTVDTWRDQEESEIQRVYVFRDSTRAALTRAVVCLVLFLAVLVITVALYLAFKNRLRVGEVFLRPIGRIDFLLCFIVLAGTGILLYRVIGIPNYLQVGDETGYWNITIWGEGETVWQHLIRQFPLRGYWCYIPQTIVRDLGKWLSVDAAAVWILFLSGVWTVFICRVFPGLYRHLAGGSARRLHIYPTLLILLTTQRLYLTSVLMDGLGMVTFFIFLYGILCILEGPGWRRGGMLAGFCASVSCSFRVAHLPAVLGMTIFFLIFALRKKKDLKRLVEGFGIGALVFLLVCIPQGIINYGRGHMGLFPYDGDPLYDDSAQPWNGRSVTVWSSDYAMAHGNIAYPLLATDDQMLTIKNQHYNNDTALTMAQLLDIYTDAPADTLMLIGKKLLIGFDQKTNIASPGDGAVPWRETRGILYSLWNYFVLFSGFFMLFTGRRVSSREKWTAGLIMLLLILPQTFMKVEWRYFLPGYFIVYYFFTFHFAGPVLENRQERRKLLEDTLYLPILPLFMFGYLTMSFLFLA